MTTTQTVTHISPALQHTASHAAFHIKIRKKAIAKYFQVLISIIFITTITLLAIDLCDSPNAIYRLGNISSKMT